MQKEVRRAESERTVYSYMYICAEMKQGARAWIGESRVSEKWTAKLLEKIRLICGSKRSRTVIRCLGALTNKIYGPEYGVIHHF
jgi:hypothetical protein